MKYTHAVVINYLFFILNTLFFLVFTSVAIRVMGEELFGLWSILNAILLFSGIGTLGMTSIVNKFASETGSDALQVGDILSTGMMILLPMAAVTSVILIFLRSWIAVKLSIEPEIQLEMNQALLITALSLFPQFLGRIPYGYLLSQLKNDVARFIDLLTNIGLWIGFITIAFISNNLVLMAGWGFVIQLFNMLVLFFILRKSCKWQWHFSSRSFKRMLNFSAFSFIESLAVLLFQQFDRILVGIVLGPTAAGVYAVSTSVGGRLSIITGQATEVMIPYASRKESLQDHKKFYEIFRKLSKVVGLLVGVFGSLLVLWMDIVLSIWISPDYARNYADVFRLVVIAYAVLSLSRCGHQTLTGVGKVKFTSIIYFITSIVMLCLVFFLSKFFGLIGVAIANFCMVSLLIFNFSVYKNYGSQSLLGSLTDLSVGIILPIVSFGATRLSNSIAFYSIFTIGIFIFALLVIARDKFLLTKIILVIKKIFHPLVLKPHAKA